MSSCGRRRFIVSVAVLGIILIVIASDLHASQLSSKDERLIENYVKKVRIDDAVGQILMVGVPADYSNYRDVTKLTKILTEVGVGSIVLNSYNCPNTKKYDDGIYLSSVIEFCNALQQKAHEGRLNLPLLLAADFEGPNYSAIRSGVVLPPSALAISAAHNEGLTQDLGRLVGTQLTSLGVHVLLGPVLDTFNVKQGNRNPLQDRCFASNATGVVSAASHFLVGLKESNILVFAKHFPSHGSIETNPHDNIIPVYEGSADRLESGLAPFQALASGFDGVMTSHILLPFSDTKELATFSSELILSKLRSKEFSQKILITDDLSSMGAIRSYQKTYDESFAGVAVKAFSAGHDILLFSHFAEINKKASFTLQDLIDVKRALASHISGSEGATQQFRKTLFRVLRAKALVAKHLGYTVEEMLNNPRRQNLFRMSSSGQDVINRAIKALRGHYEPNGQDERSALVKSAIREATTVINQKTNFNLQAYAKHTKVVFCVLDSQRQLFENAFKNVFLNSTFLSVPVLKDGKEFRLLKKRITELFNKSDLLVYTVCDKSDADLLSGLLMKTKSSNPRIIALCHNSPLLFENELLRETTIIANFTNHNKAFEVDVEILSGRLKPKPIQNMPISIGENGKFYSVENTSWMKPASSFESIACSSLKQDRVDHCQHVLSYDYLLIPKTFSYIVFRILFLSFIVTCCVGFLCVSKHIENNKARYERLGFWLKLVFKMKWVLVVLFLLLANLLLWFSPETASIVDHFGELSTKIRKIWNALRS